VLTAAVLAAAVLAAVVLFAAGAGPREVAGALGAFGARGAGRAATEEAALLTAPAPLSMAAAVMAR